MKRAIVLALLLGLCSCGAIKEWAVNAGKQGAAAFMEAQVFNKAPELKAAADTDGDNKVSWDEMIAYLGSGGGIIGLLLWLLKRSTDKKITAEVGGAKATIDAATVELSNRLRRKTGDLYRAIEDVR